MARCEIIAIPLTPVRGSQVTAKGLLMPGDSGFQVGSDAPQFYESTVGPLMSPFVAALVAATVNEGDSVLDVACGTGFATRAAANVAGPGSRVDGTDINSGMLAMAQSVPDQSGASLHWTEASALDLPYPDGTFDAVICQQGLQFFPDPSTGVREMKRVTKEGGRIGATVWSPTEHSPYLRHETEMLARHGNGTAPPFTATEDQLREWFRNGGVDEVSIELIIVDVDLPPIATYVPEHVRALPWSAGFFALSEQEQSEAIAELDEALASYRTETGVRVPFGSFLVTATV